MSIGCGEAAFRLRTSKRDLWNYGNKDIWYDEDIESFVATLLIHFLAKVEVVPMAFRAMWRDPMRFLDYARNDRGGGGEMTKKYIK